MEITVVDAISLGAMRLDELTRGTFLEEDEEGRWCGCVRGAICVAMMSEQDWDAYKNNEIASFPKESWFCNSDLAIRALTLAEIYFEGWCDEGEHSLEEVLMRLKEEGYEGAMLSMG